MTLDQIIDLFDDIETGKEGQLIGYHLHEAIEQANEMSWDTNGRYSAKFSGFLRALRAEITESDRAAVAAFDEAQR
jgi:hypothetical protein